MKLSKMIIAQCIFQYEIEKKKNEILFRFVFEENVEISLLKN